MIGKKVIAKYLKQSSRNEKYYMIYAVEILDKVLVKIKVENEMPCGGGYATKEVRQHLCVEQYLCQSEDLGVVLIQPDKIAEIIKNAEFDIATKRCIEHNEKNKKRYGY